MTGIAAGDTGINRQEVKEIEQPGPCKPMQTPATPCRAMQTQADPCRPRERYGDKPVDPMQSHANPSMSRERYGDKPHAASLSLPGYGGPLLVILLITECECVRPDHMPLDLGLISEGKCCWLRVGNLGCPFASLAWISAEMRLDWRLKATTKCCGCSVSGWLLP